MTWMRHSNISGGFDWTPPSQSIAYRGHTHPVLSDVYIHVDEHLAPHGRGPQVKGAQIPLSILNTVEILESSMAF
jgi:hypothetical protein